MSKEVFSLVEADSLNLAGGKAYALGKMIRAGFCVPSGFVVSADAFMVMTPQLQDLLLNHFDKLHANFVAVRSSAINEDGTDAAWAGQLDTFLNCNRDNLLQNIQKCWESANSLRAKSYAKQKGLQATKVAVVVQEMIQSEVSGVAFSAHPVTSDHSKVVIEAGFGLGEAIVSGQVTPDTYIVNKATKQIAEKYVAPQKKQLVRNAAGKTIWQDLEITNAPKLSGEQIAELCSLTVKLETFFKHPVDVEWAINNGNIYILQSRPITTLISR
jgi:pyruvate,water dikinase